MRTRVNPIAAVSFAVSLGLFAPVVGDEAKVEGDLARLQGRWVTRAGAKREVRVTLDVQGRNATVDIATPQGLKVRVRGEIRVDETTSPRALDWVRFTGLDDTELPDIPAIYEIKGGSFRVCNGGPNSARPSEFKPGEGVLADVHVFEREKAPDSAGPNSCGPTAEPRP
jgi:uncharacterized protein (TIGR03067 family)